MTDFLRLRIDVTYYHELVRFLDMLESDGFVLADALSGRGGNMDWTEAIRDFLFYNWAIWHHVAEANKVSPTGLSFDIREAHATLERTAVGDISNLGLFEVLRLLRAMTGEDPASEATNRNRPLADQIPNPDRDARLIAGHDRGLLIPALRRLNDLLEITPADIEGVLSLKPIFDSLSVEEFRSWNGWEPMDLPEGGQALHVPYPEYHPVVHQWYELLYQTPFYIDPYAALPEDPTPDGVPFSVIGTYFPPEYFKNATLDQIRRYMLLCTRWERFCDGHIAGEFEDGVIQAAFNRLALLVEESQ